LIRAGFGIPLVFKTALEFEAMRSALALEGQHPSKHMLSQCGNALPALAALSSRSPIS
jgi:hypothetical protein